MTVNIALSGAPRKSMTQKPAESSSESESNHSEKEKPESPTPPATSENEDEEKSMKKSRGAKQRLSKKLPEGESSQSKKPSEGESSQSKKPSEGESSQSKKPSEGESSQSKSKRRRNFGLILSQKPEVDLAEWIRANPMLYIRTMTAFKDGKKKKDLWGDKAEEMEVESGEMLMTWYRSIRTRISKMLKEESKSGATFMKRTDRDKFLDSNFSFLRECIIRKEGRSAVQLKMKSTLTQKSTPDSS